MGRDGTGPHTWMQLRQLRRRPSGLWHGRAVRIAQTVSRCGISELRLLHSGCWEHVLVKPSQGKRVVVKRSWKGEKKMLQHAGEHRAFLGGRLLWFGARPDRGWSRPGLKSHAREPAHHERTTRHDPRRRTATDRKCVCLCVCVRAGETCAARTEGPRWMTGSGEVWPGSERQALGPAACLSLTDMTIGASYLFWPAAAVGG